MTDHHRYEIDLMTDRPHSARIYDYLLGGKTNYAADREAGDALLAHARTARIWARANRAFMHRAVHHLAAEHGIRQFLDIGTGIPTAPNLHEIAQAVAPEARVVYVDNDPIVLAHARALLVGTREGRTAYIDADLREPRAILDSRELLDTLDLTRPVALTMMAVVHFLDDHEAYSTVRQLVDALPSGSFLALTSGTTEGNREEGEKAVAEYRRRGTPAYPRDRAEVTRFFDGLDLLEPGVERLHKWRPEQRGTPIGIRDEEIGGFGGVARKP